jgi:hypothetical protein
VVLPVTEPLPENGDDPAEAQEFDLRGRSLRDQDGLRPAGVAHSPHPTAVAGMHLAR